ncbi:hypothetical protein CAPTEDRAFT_106238, partial [Capitella teleta]
IDTKQLKTCCKWVRPIASQGEFESRKLWTNVTEALKNGNIEEATQHKRFVRSLVLLLCINPNYAHTLCIRYLNLQT